MITPMNILSAIANLKDIGFLRSLITLKIGIMTNKWMMISSIFNNLINLKYNTVQTLSFLLPSWLRSL